MRYFTLLLILITLWESKSFAQSEWLKKIVVTTRISASHYSDMVCDTQGNVYIASFIKDTLSGDDHIYIVKISPGGEKIWEQGLSNTGRAIAIDIDTNERIWVTGYFTGALSMGSKHIGSKSTPDKQPSAFIAVLDTNGICKRLSGVAQNSMTFNLHINNKGIVMLTGQIGKTGSDDRFVSIFNGISDMNKLIVFDADVYDVSSDKEGNFYLAGSFYGTLKYQNTPLLFTKSNKNRDGFLAKISEKGKILWIRQFGLPGDIPNGYTSQDACVDLAVNNNEVLMPCVVDSAYRKRFLHLAKYDAQTGKLLSDKLIANNINTAGAASIEYVNDHCYLTFLCKDSCNVNDQHYSFQDSFRVFIIKTDKNLNIIDTRHATSAGSFMIRESTAYKNNIYFSGHYLDSFSLGDNSLEGSAVNTLFLYKTEL